MANLPAISTKISDLQISDGQIGAIVELIARGERPNDIARRLAPHDPSKRKLWRKRLWHIVATDERVATGIAMRARSELILGLVPATNALGRKAATGRTDAIKLLLEATGFHNPKVRHEHSGEVTIKVDMPRPKFVDHEENAGQIADADVVD